MISEYRQAVDICILIPCYNNMPGLITSINSIQYKTNQFLVLVVDDGSNIAITRKELFQHVPAMINIQIVRLKKNSGISKALNAGLDFIYANYSVNFIARLDCGDICNPKRFYHQVNYFANNPDTDLLGTWCYFKDMDSGDAYEFITPTQHELIKKSMYFRNVFIHPTVMWRANSLEAARYPEIYPHAEDYGLFYDMISKKRTAIMDEFLVTCEINRQGISFVNRMEQLKSRIKVIRAHGKNNWWIAAGTFKLLLLMSIPYKIIYSIKKKLYRHKPDS